MAKLKPPTKTLSRIFDRTTAPVYLVNSEYTIVYANEACARWVGLELEALISASCVYASQNQNAAQPSGQGIELAASKVQGLCPDPKLLNASATVEADDHASQRCVVYATDAHRKSWRRANMSPLLDVDQHHLGVLVVCEDQVFDSPPPEDDVASTRRDQLQRLHVGLANIRSVTDQIYSLESLVGTSPNANRMRRQAKTAIENQTDFLIRGPRGSGKEHLARTIHSLRDQTKTTELIPVHCSIADQQLIQQNIKDIVASRTDSKLKPDSQQQDWLLLLDVDQLGEAAQHELLGFFQLPNFPLRTITTCSECLIALAARGEYSEELAHHLTTFTIELAALSQRIEDVPSLAQALLERDNFRRDRQLSGLSNEVLTRFTEFNWPENIDQLNRTIQLAAQTCKTSQLESSDLPNEFQHALKAMRVGTSVETEINLDAFLGKVEQELVARALKQAKGNKTKAAKLLGISRPKLLRRIQFFGLETPAFEPVDDVLDSSAFEELD